MTGESQHKGDGMAEIRLEKVCKIYDKNVVAVKDFTMTIADKEFIVLVGPSGCGKSTTLRMIAGLETITKGELYVDGQLFNDVPPKDRDVSMVFQNYALFPYLTVFDNMAFGLSMRKEPKAVIEQKVREAAEILDIGDLLKRKPKALSGGQRQRVAIGRAIVRNPRVFLMDEPLSNLDAKLRNQMRTELIKLRQRLDTTFVYVTHDQTEAMTLGDRIVIMDEGVVQQIGTPQDVFDHPANRFVAGFIGSPQMNFFEGQLIRSGDGYGVSLDGQLLVLRKTVWASLPGQSMMSQPVVLGVRPEHMDLVPVGLGQLIATIDVCEMLGSFVNLHVLVGEQRAVVSVPAADWQRVAAGEKQVGLAFPEKSIHLFHENSGESLLQ